MTIANRQQLRQYPVLRAGTPSRTIRVSGSGAESRSGTKKTILQIHDTKVLTCA